MDEDIGMQHVIDYLKFLEEYAYYCYEWADKRAQW